MRNFYLFLTNRNMATRRNVPNKGIDGGRIQVPYANGARFFAPLTDSVVPNRSMWPITFSRSAGATVQDHEWIVRNVLSGEARFQGARRVQNWLTYSQAVDNVAWTKANLTVTGNTTLAPDGTLTADTLTSTVTPLVFTECIQISNITTSVWGYYTYSGYFKYNGQQFIQVLGNSAAFSNVYVNFDIQNGTITATSGSITQSITAVANGFYRISATFIATGVLVNARMSMWFIDTGTSVRGSTYNGDGIKAIYIWGQQFEDITAQSIQWPSEYVSTNVLSSPFHGAMVDGVKYFDTDISGNQLSPDGYLAESAKTNLFTDSEAFNLWTLWGTGAITTNVAIAPDGRMTADLFTLSTSNEWQSVSKSITTTASIYGFSVYVKPNGHNYVQLLAAAGISAWYINFDLLNGVVGTSSSYTGRIEALPNGWYRLKATTPTVLAATGWFLIAPVPNASASRGNFVSGTGTSWVYLWWASLELWATSSYISSTLGTRNEDRLEYELRNIQGTKWTVYAEATTYFTTTNTSLLWLTWNSCRILGSSGTTPWFYLGSGTQVISNDGTSNTTSSNSVSTSQYNRVLWKYSGVLNEICLNGTLTSGTFDGNASYTNLCVGNSTANNRWLYGSIRNLQIWDYEISDAEAVALTTI